MAEKYNKDKVYNKIISYDYDSIYRYSSRYELRNYLGVEKDSNYDYYSPTYFNYRQNESDDAI